MLSPETNRPHRAAMYHRRADMLPGNPPPGGAASPWTRRCHCPPRRETMGVFNALHRRVPPELFKIVVRAGVLMEDMQDDINEIQQDPLSTPGFTMPGPDAFFPQ